MLCKLAPEMKHLRQKVFVKNTIQFLFLLVVRTLEANKGKSERKCYNIVLLTRGSMRTVLQVS